VGRREIVRPLGQVAKVEGHVQVGMKAVDICGSRSLSFRGAAISVRGDGNGVLAAGAEVRKQYVSGDNASWKYWGGGIRSLLPE
jgi:hypothetical protein